MTDNNILFPSFSKTILCLPAPSSNHASVDDLSNSRQNIQDGNLDKWQNEQSKSKTDDIANLPNIQNGETENKWIKGEDELPTFPEEVYQNLPPLLKECVDNATSKEDRASILLGAIACFSACFPNVKGVYDEREVYANLYFFLVANAGMGKGALTLTKDLVAPIDRELKDLAKSAYDVYKEAMREYKASKNKKDLQQPEEPRQLALIIPANSSAASFQKILADNDGHGLLFETEGDTLSNTLKADYGNYSDSLRKAFHHESISFSRRTDRAFEEVEHPCLSTVLAGTPEQVRRLIPDTENGLMSRFMFYHLPFKRGFRNVFATTDVSSSKSVIFRQLGEKFKRLREDFLRRGEMEFSISEIEQVLFVNYFSDMNEECCDEIDDRIQGVVCRLGLVAFRIMMVLSILRELGKYVPHDRNDTTPTKLVCQTEDYETAMMIIDTLAQHTAFVYRRLESTDFKVDLATKQSSTVAKRMPLYNILPDEFTKGVYSEKVELLGLNSSTTDKWLPWYIKRGLLVTNGYNKYWKIKPEEVSSTTRQ